MLSRTCGQRNKKWAISKEAMNKKKNELINIITLKNDLFLMPDFGKSFFMNSLFFSQNVREIVNRPSGDYIPIFLSEIPILFWKGILPID